MVAGAQDASAGTSSGGMPANTGGAPASAAAGQVASAGESTGGATGGSAATAGVSGGAAPAGMGGDAGNAASGSPGGGLPAGGAAEGGAPMGGGAGGEPPQQTGPVVDTSTPQLYELEFTAREADPQASEALGRQYAYLDTRAEPQGLLVVYLHGAGDFSDCGNGALGMLVASWGFHWFGPCYLSNYGVDNCGADIAGCRLEAFEGTDHHDFVDISRPNSIEERIIQGLAHLEELNPEGDWAYFVDNGAPRWSDIVITGHSHGASSSGIIGMNRLVARVVMLAGPYDMDQPWLNGTPMTPRERFFGFTHASDSQHQGHLAAFEALGLPGEPVLVDSSDPPYGDSHRLYSEAAVSDAHGSVTSGNIEAFVPVWRYLYGAP